MGDYIKFCKLNIFVFLSIIFSWVVKAEDPVGCNSLYNHPIDAKEVQVFVKCGFVEGYISGEKPLKSLKVVVTDTRSGEQRFHTLANPPGPAKHYFAALPPEQTQWLVSHIPGLRFTDRVDTAYRGFGVDPDEEITVRAGKKHKLGQLGNATEVAGLGYNPKNLQNCSYESHFVFMKLKECNNLKLCQSYVQCELDGKLFTNIQVFCRASGESCPSADDCVKESNQQAQIVAKDLISQIAESSEDTQPPTNEGVKPEDSPPPTSSPAGSGSVR